MKLSVRVLEAVRAMPLATSLEIADHLELSVKTVAATLSELYEANHVDKRGVAHHESGRKLIRWVIK